METAIRRLPDSELEVMQALWRCTLPATRQEIEAAMHRQPSLAPTTLLTLLGRLNEKGFLAVEKVGRVSRYRPLVERRAYLAAQSSSFVQKLCGGSISAFANALCDSGLTREELDELGRLLREGQL